jgi:hypothetical protein
MPCMFPTRLPWTVAIQLTGQVVFWLCARGGLACAVMADPSLTAQARARGRSGGGVAGGAAAGGMRVFAARVFRLGGLLLKVVRLL